jgi:hypothetical protein
MTKNNKKWDAFISHASEDKERLVRPLAIALESLGVSIWYDEFSLTPGDSLSRSIDKGLVNSKYGIVVISHNFIVKPWPEYELRGLVAREIEEDKVIIPIWLGVTRKDVISFSPTLADKIAITTDNLNAEEISIQVLRVVRPDIYSSHPRAELRHKANGKAIQDLQHELERAKHELAETKEKLGEYLCPICNAPLSMRLDAPADDEGNHWDIREIFDCGYQNFGGYIERPCPSDPLFPCFEDYELKFNNDSKDEHSEWWLCHAWPKTEMAKRLSLPAGYGNTMLEAEQFVRNRYFEYSKKYKA